MIAATSTTPNLDATLSSSASTITLLPGTNHSLTIVLDKNSVETEIKEKTIEEIIQEEFADTPIMIEVARCESHLKQFERDGLTVLRGKITPEDVGVFQINEYFHLSSSKQMKLDIHTLEGNIAYAKYLYKTQGTQPWRASKACWGKYTELAKK